MEKSELQRFRSECVAAHNFFRAVHGTPPLGWSSRLADSAQLWAEQLANSGSVRSSPDSDHDYGENLASLWGSELTGQKVTRIWYEEGRHFNYDKPRVSSRTRSFCQVVWEGSREVGAGAAFTKHGKKIVVARYYPPVNKKDVARNVKKARITQNHGNEATRAYDTRWSRLYLGLKQFHEECLEAHNEYRLRHGAAPVRWSANLAWEAQQWAEELARNGELRHNDDDTIGENLAGMVGGELSGREAVDMWYDEIEHYDFDNPQYDEETSNFTQVVWVATESLGVGRAIEGDLCVAVAFYEPPGNMEGSFGDNVLRMGSTVRVRKIREPKGFVPPPPDLDNFRLECLVTHNYYRARHGSPPLVLSSALTDEAQYWAERLLVTGTSEDLDSSRIGICVAVLDKKNVSGIKVSELWYKEILNYDFDSPGFSSQTRDFTQLVWLSSRKLGVGKASSDEGVTVVVARFEPVGNIDGLFVQNVKKRGHERGSCEPMIFHVELRYRVRADSKSTNSFLSWENEGTQTFGEIERGDLTKTSSPVPRWNGLNRAKFLLNRLLEDLDKCRNSGYLSPPLSTAASLSWSDLDHFDENENIVHRADDQQTLVLPGNDHFTRLVWIDPQSPTLQRKETTQHEREEGRQQKENAAEGSDDEDEEKYESDDSWDEEDARTVEEQENRDHLAEDLIFVIEEPAIYAEEGELEEAVLYSDPEDDLCEHICETKRSLSLDSEGTEPEMQKGNVLYKVAFFETFQQSFPAKSPSSSGSGSSLRRSFIQEDFQELKEEEDVVQEEEEEQEEHECQLEYDDVFPAHREEEEEAEVEEDIYENDGEEDEEESLVSVSDTEDTLDFMDFPDQIEEHGTQKLYDNFCVTHEFKEEDPTDVEIFDGDSLQQYADITEEEGKPISSTKHVFVPVNISTATEFQNTEPFKLCKDDSPDLIQEDVTDNYKEEFFRTSEAEIQVPFCASQRTLDPDYCCITIRREDLDTRLKELSSRIGLLSPVEDSETEQSVDFLDFSETVEGELLNNIVDNGRVSETKNEKPPIEEVCEAVFKDNVQSEIDIEELFARLERDENEQVAKEEVERSTSPETVHFTLRDSMSERSAAMEETSAKLGLISVNELDGDNAEDEHELESDITLEYNSREPHTSDDESPVCEETCEAVERESTTDLYELSTKVDTLLKEERPEEKRSAITITTDSLSEEQFCEPVLRDYDLERARVFDEMSTEIGLVPVSSDVIYSCDERTEILEYEHVPTTEFVSELPEVTEHVTAEVRSDVRCEINFEEMFARIDEVEKHQDERASLFVEENTVVEEQTFERPSSPIHITDERVNSDGVEEVKDMEPVEEEKRASVIVEEEPFVEEARVESPSSPIHIPDERVNTEVVEEVKDIEPDNEEKRASVIVVEETFVDEATLERPSSPMHITDERVNTEVVEEIEDVDPIDEEKRASVFLEEDTFVEETRVDRPSSPRHIADERVNSDVVEESTEIEQDYDEKRASVIVEEKTFVDEATLERPSSPRHIADERVNTEVVEESTVIEPDNEENRASLIVEEESVVEEATLERPLSPRHIADERVNSDVVEEMEDVEPIDDEKRASVFLEEDTIVEETMVDRPSSPRHIADESVNTEEVEESTEIEQDHEEKRASIILEGEIFVNEARVDRPSSPRHIADERVNSAVVEEIEDAEPIEEQKRASLFLEEDTFVEDVALERPSSPRNIANESISKDLVEEVEVVETIEEEMRASLFLEEDTFVEQTTINSDLVEEIEEAEPIEEEKRASLYLEEDTFVEEETLERPSSPMHIANEIVSKDLVEEIEVVETVKEEKRASLFLEEGTFVEEATLESPSSPMHIANESVSKDLVEEIEVVETVKEEKRASLFLEEGTFVEEATLERPSSPMHIANESVSKDFVEEIEVVETIKEDKRASLFLEESTFVEEATLERPSSPRHVANESVSKDLVEEIEVVETIKEDKRASLFLKESTFVEEAALERPSSPMHIASESVSKDLVEEIEVVETIEEDKRASLFLEESTFVEEATLERPSSPMHIASESVSKDLVEEIEVVETIKEEKRASLFLEESTFVEEAALERPSSPIHIASESVSKDLVEEIEVVETIKEDKRASLFLEESSFVEEAALERPSSPIHIASESVSKDLVEEIEVVETIKEEKRASLFLEEDTFVEEATLERPSSPMHIANETVRNDLVEKIEDIEPIEEEKRASLYLEEGLVLSEVRLDNQSHSQHIACEGVNTNIVEETKEIETADEEERISYTEEDAVFHEVTPNIPSSPTHIAYVGEDSGPVEEVEHAETIEQEKRASLFLEEDAFVDEVISDTPSSPKHTAGEASNFELIESVDEERTEDQKCASLYTEEETIVNNVTFDASLSSMYVAGESVAIERIDLVQDEDQDEQEKRASLFLEENTIVSEMTHATPSSPKHVAGESINLEPFEEVREEPTEENKRASLFIEEDSHFDEVTLASRSTPTHLAGEVSGVVLVEDITEEEETRTFELAQEIEEHDVEVTHSSVSYEDPGQSTHVAGEIPSAIQLEVAKEDDCLKFEDSEQFEEFEGICRTETLKEASQTAHVAGEISESNNHDEALEEVVHLEEILEYEDNQDSVFTTDTFEVNEKYLYVAGELLNVDPREESSEEERPEEEAFAEEFEESEIHTTTVALKSPQSLLSIAAAALELKIDAAQQELDEAFPIVTEEAVQYSEEEAINVIDTPQSEASPSSYSHVAEEFEEVQEYEETLETQITTEQPQTLDKEDGTTDAKVSDLPHDVPVIVIRIAGEISSGEEDEICYVRETSQESEKEEVAEMYCDNEETNIVDSTPEEVISQSHVAGDVAMFEFHLEEDEIKTETGSVEEIEESEGVSVSEMIPEYSSSMQISSELEDVQDYVTRNDEETAQTHCAIAYEESDDISEGPVSESLPSLYITEELTHNGIYDENVEEEASDRFETADEYNDNKEPLRMETPVVVLQPPLQMAAELSDSDFGDGVDEEDLSEGEFAEEFEDIEQMVEQGTHLEDVSEPVSIAAEIDSSSGPQIVEEENELLDEIDDAEEYGEQETLVSSEHHSVVESSVFVAGDIECPDRQDHVIREEIQEFESANRFEETKEIIVLEKTVQVASSPVHLAQELTEQETVEMAFTQKDEESNVYLADLSEENQHFKGGQGDVTLYQIRDERDASAPTSENVLVTSTIQVSTEVQHQVVVSQKEQRSESIHHFVERTEVSSVSHTQHDESETSDMEQLHEYDEILTTHSVKQVSSSTSFHSATEFTSREIQYTSGTKNGKDVRYIEMFGEVGKVHEISSEKTVRGKKENGRRFETSVELSEGVLEKEVEDREEKKLAKELSIEETEVRLLKSEVIEHKTAEHQILVVRASATEEVETTKNILLTKSVVKEDEVGDQVLRDDSATDILRDDEASLEDESVFEEEIDIMRLDEALSEEEFRGEGSETSDRRHSGDSEPEDSEQEGEERESVDGEHQEEIETETSDRSEPVYEEEVEIRSVQPIFEEEFEIRRVQEEKRMKPYVSKVQESVYEEEIEVVAFKAADERDKEDRENKESSEEEEEPREQSPVFEEEVEVLAQEVFAEEEQSQTDESTVCASVFEEELEIEARKVYDRDEDLHEERRPVTHESKRVRAMSEGDTPCDLNMTFARSDSEGTEHVQTPETEKPPDAEHAELYEGGEGALTRYYVEMSSTESLEPASEEAEEESSFTETYVRQGEPLEENLEEFILVRYGDEFESSGEEDVGDLREIYVIPEEDNDGDENSAKRPASEEELEEQQEPRPESCFEQGYENIGLEEIRESPEFDIDDSPDDELDEEEQRQLEEYERLESFVILEEKLSQVESDEDCDDEIAELQAEEGDENVFHSDAYSSSQETLHEDEMGDTMVESALRAEGAAGQDTEQPPGGNDGDQTEESRPSEGVVHEDTSLQESHEEISEEESHEEHPIRSSNEDKEQKVQESSAEGMEVDITGSVSQEVPRKMSGHSETSSDEGNDKTSAEGESKDLVASGDSPEASPSRGKREEKAEHSPSSDSCGEHSVSSKGSLSSTPSVDLEGLDEFEQDCLLQHNVYRRQHRVKPLVWSEELAAGAKEWAEHLASVNSLEHPEEKDVGENLASVQGKDLSGSEVAEMWYGGTTDYNFETPAFNAKCGNFTNVVWASSREFGVAKSVADDGTCYVVARYKPMGNVVGEFKENVKPPKEASTRLKRRRSSARRRSRSGAPPFTPAEREKFKNECVISHNYYRTFHGAPALRWSPLLAAEAQNYAERLAKTDSLTHSGQKDRGENLAYTWDAPLSARGAVDMWYDEAHDYDYECPGFTSDTGHFTQMVWVGTEEFGMGMAVAPDGRNIVVGRYFPPGNIVGQFQENVRPRDVGLS